MSIAPFAIGEPAVAQTRSSSGPPKTPKKRRTVAAPDRTLTPEPR